jgi:hypothetical protein
MTELDVFLAGALAGRLIRKDNGNLQFLAMSIGGARMLDEVDKQSWLDLADSVGLSQRYARTTLASTTERVVIEASAVVEEPGYLNDHAHGVYEGVLERSERA